MGQDIRPEEILGFMISRIQQYQWPYGSYRSDVYHDVLWLSKNPGKSFAWVLYQNGTKLFDLERKAWMRTQLELMNGMIARYFIFKDNKFEAFSYERMMKLC